MKVIIRVAEDKRYSGFRWLHGAEGGRMPPLDMPEIVPPYDVRGLDITQEVQYMIRDLAHHFCPLLTNQKLRVLHRADKAMTNKPKNGFDGGIPHPDYWNGQDLKADTPIRYDKMQRGFGGSFFRGIKEGNLIRVKPGTHCIDATKPMPSVQTIIDNQWFVIAVSIHKTDPRKIVHFPQGYIDGIQYPIAYPFIADRDIFFESRNVIAWNSDELPEVDILYNPVSPDKWRTPEVDE